MNPAPPPDASISPRLRIFQDVQSLFSTYAGASCLYVLAYARNERMILIPARKRHQLHDFERSSDKIAARDRFVHQVLFAGHGQTETVRVHFLSALVFFPLWFCPEGASADILIIGDIA